MELIPLAISPITLPMMILIIAVLCVVLFLSWRRMNIMEQQMRKMILQNENNKEIGVKQFELLNKHLRDHHEWNRRDKSIQYSGLFHPRVKAARLLLDERFNLFTRVDPIPLKQILEAMENDKIIRSEVNYLLTYYENAAIACKKGVADEDIIKEMFKGAFISYREKMMNYINHVRKIRDYGKLWINFTELADKWRKEDNPGASSLRKTGY